MSESNESKPRPRWFQFDLRLLFVVVAAVAVVLSLEIARRRKPLPTGFRGALQKLEVGEAADIGPAANGLSLEVGGSRSGTIAEVGDDFLVIRSNHFSQEWVIPFDEIRFIERYSPREPSTAKTKTMIPFKTAVEFDPFGAGTTKTVVPSKTSIRKTRELFDKTSP
jgi:hypothetical protein